MILLGKKLRGFSHKFGFKLDIQANVKITDSLDATFNLYDGTVFPVRKNDQNSYYMNVESNHPKKVFE